MRWLAKRSWLIFVFGVGLLIAGGALPSGSYLIGVIQNIGVALLLLVPLLLIQRAVVEQLDQVEENTRLAVEDLSDQVLEVREQVERTTARLDELSGATLDAVQEGRRRDQDLFKAFEENPTLATLRPLLDRADDLNAISASGVRVAIPGTPLRMRLRTRDIGAQFAKALAATDHVPFAVRLEHSDGELLEHIQWWPAQDAAQFATSVADALQRRNAYPGDTAFDATELFKRLLETLRIGIEARTRARPIVGRVPPIIEMTRPNCLQSFAVVGEWGGVMLPA
jgi:hypothetical protein